MTTIDTHDNDLGKVIQTKREEDDSGEDSASTTEVDAPPLVVVEAMNEVAWPCTLPEVSVTNWGTPSGPSSGTGTPNSRSPSMASLWSETSYSDGVHTPRGEDTRSLSYTSMGHGSTRRARHASTSLALTHGKIVETTRLCASQEIFATGEPQTQKQKHTIKSMFLDVFHPESHRRQRSASSGEVRQRFPSGGDSKVRKFFSRIRSHSHSELLSGQNRRSSTSAVDLTEVGDSHVNLSPEVKGHLGDDLPITAINTRLLGRYRKHHGKKRRWSVFEQQLLKNKNNRDNVHPINNEDHTANKEGCVVTTEPGRGSPVSGRIRAGSLALTPDYAKRMLGRTRSNSDSKIAVLDKKRKRGFMSKDSKMIDRLLDFHFNKRHKQKGSLSSLTADGQLDPQQKNKQHRKSISDISNKENLLGVEGDHVCYGKERSMSCHNLTDFAVDDYFANEDTIDSVDHLRRGSKETLSPYYAEEGQRSRRHRFSIDHIWNAFRGRRLSHDVGAAGRHVTETVVPWLRGKSRSVDHSIHSPFDLDVLRRKIGERTSSEPSRDASSPSPEPVDGSKENISPSEKKMGGRSQPNPPSMTYTVSANDTLTSVAARFDTTPSELTKLNRLNTRFLFPGQVLAVPDKSAINDEKTAPVNAQEESNGQDLLANIRPVTPTQRGDTKIPLSPPNYPRTPANSVDVDRSLDQDCLEKFLKISVRHITDGQGVVAGVLLVTPNAVMFDPNVSDPLVIEHGPESYGVIAPMEYVVNAALFYDIAHMKVKDTNLPKPEIPKPEIYWGPSQDRPESPGKDASLCKDATFPELAASQDDNDSSCSCGGDTRESSAFPKAFEHELLSPIGSDASPASGEGQPSPVQPLSSIQHQVSAPSAGDLTPIAEAGRLEDTQATPPNLAQTQCDNTAAQELAQNDSTSAASQIAEDVTCNDKKRTTSVTFDLTGDEESIPDLGGEASMQESRKQKVLKRLSYPLSWMESFNTDKENMPQNQPLPPSSAPPSGGMMTSMPDGTDANKAGMFSNVFNMSNVSNMLSSSPKYLVDFSSGLFARSPSDSTSSLRDVSELDTPPGSFDGYRLGQSVFYRKQSSLSSEKEERKGIPIFQPGRPSLDFARRPGNQQPLFVSSQQTPPSSLTQQTSPQVISHPAGAPITPNQQAHKRAQYKDGPKFGLKSMVSMDDMPELFASFDNLGFKEDSLKELIPKPAASCEDPPLYLCLKMGKPAGKSIPKSTPVMSYGKKRMRPEYWFSIPRNRSDELYNFFQRWAQAIYGELNEDDIAAKGFVLIEEDTDIWDDDVQGKGEGGDNIGGELTEMTKESWEKIKAPYVKLYSLMKSQMTISTESENPEVVSMSEELRRALYSSSSLTSLDLEVFLPEVVGTTDIVTDHVRKSMYKKLPVRCQGYAWKLVFSTAQHGFSLNSLYRKMTDVDSAVLVFIQDTNQNVFGALVSCSLHVSELFYGTGESFLFTFHPQFEVFPWTGENTFFIKGNNESLYIGGGDGNFGLWLDGDLYQGRTQPCKTYNNPPLTDTEDFIIKTIECWCFE
ncbi:oxidation resistance protein 1 isoform X3 [Palaemon carinicauda]|uniref:oxidation resistance protein 1 isoform X3 n=1 Tax=Palaemon carinicauda TaxID=392227 RepID=UPI0035B62BD2